tara:strand:- start:376 stop:552 length:177 start_codon:yes stop_codon:yes gene_type:complete
MGVKKRKLGSKNPKYMVVENDNSPIIKEKKLMCNVKVRDINGNVVEGTTIPVYGVWYE